MSNFTNTNVAGGLPGPAPTTAGPHRSDLLNKLDPTVDSQDGGTQITGPGTNRTREGHVAGGTTHGTTHGTHGTHGAHGTHGLATGPGAGAGAGAGVGAGAGAGAGLGAGATHGHAHTATTHGGVGNTHGTHATGAPEGTYGPHSSRIANALDPRVDSDLDNTRTHAGVGHTTTTGHTGVGHTTAGRTGAVGTAGGVGGTTLSSGAPEGTYGPHGSRMANAADPRVDSDRDHRAHVGAGHTGAVGHTGGLGHSAAATNAAATTSHHGGNATVNAGPAVHPGPASNTAGPHKSNLLNKLDPSVNHKGTVQQQEVYRS